MVSIEYLKRRADEFLETAQYNFTKKMYDLAAFSVEQYMQLYLKYFLAKKVGYFPKTYSVSSLFKEAGKICSMLLEFYKEKALEISAIEDAYISSRYLPREFDEETVSAMLRIAEEFRRVMEKCLQE